MYATYARQTEFDLLTRVGHRVKRIESAKRRAEKLQALECEIRDESMPRSRSLIAIFFNGEWVGSPPA